MMRSQSQSGAITSIRPSLAVASANPGKIREFRSLLGDAVHIVSLVDLGLDAPEETGATFEENALIKARHLFAKSGMVTLADDSGLEVDALSGKPGVHSARFAGDHHNDADNRAVLVRQLDAVPDDARAARFVAVIALIDVDGGSSLYRGTCEGTIVRVERGRGGFGYDSLFELEDGRTMAELDPVEKNAVSHRAQALQQALPGLRTALGLASSNESVETP